MTRNKKEKPPVGQAVQVNFDTTIVPHSGEALPASAGRRSKFSQAFMEWRLFIPVTVINSEEGGHDDD